MIDVINGLLELLGGCFIWLSCKRLYEDKQVKGVSMLHFTFFCFWGWWNLFYYPTLNQWMSFFGGLNVVAANTLWVVLAVHYTRINKKIA